MWFWGLIPIQVNLAFQFFSFGKPTKSPTSPQSYFRLFILFPLHWKTCALVQLSFFLSSPSGNVLILLKQTVPLREVNSLRSVSVTPGDTEED